MKTIKDVYKGQYDILGSSFISFLVPTSSREEVNNKLKDLHKEHNKARHICYACNIDGYVHSSDDGEPSSTAGKPLLQILTANNLINVSLFVVRYFGGTKLGAGRLLRSYVEAGTLAVNKAKFYEIKDGFLFNVNASYEQYNHIINYLTKFKCKIENVHFNEIISFDIISEVDISKELKERFLGLDFSFINKAILVEEDYE